jgi:hypothetical protein
MISEVDLAALNNLSSIKPRDVGVEVNFISCVAELFSSLIRIFRGGGRIVLA